MYNKSIAFLVSRAAYAMFRISVGLLLHSYQTMQSLLSSDKSFIWLTLLPTVLLAVVTIVWRMILVPVFGQFIACNLLPWKVCLVLPFVGNVLVFFCIYWQSILLFLLFRFSVARKIIA